MSRPNKLIPDFLSPILYWPLIEASIGIIAACLPMLGPLNKIYHVNRLMDSPRIALTSVYLKIIERSRRGSKSSGNHNDKQVMEHDARPSDSEGYEESYPMPR
jgi:hypothetical protein